MALSNTIVTCFIKLNTLLESNYKAVNDRATGYPDLATYYILEILLLV